MSNDVRPKPVQPCAILVIDKLVEALELFVAEFGTLLKLSLVSRHLRLELEQARYVPVFQLIGSDLDTEFAVGFVECLVPFFAFLRWHPEEYGQVSLHEDERNAMLAHPPATELNPHLGAGLRHAQEREWLAAAVDIESKSWDIVLSLARM